jgi:hypothetical protein
MTSKVLLSTALSRPNIVGLLKQRTRAEMAQLEQELLAVLQDMEEESTLNSTAMERGHDQRVDGDEIKVSLSIV